MVQYATNILTLLTVLLHSFLGCCWHHQHGCSDNMCTAEREVAEGSSTADVANTAIRAGDTLPASSCCQHTHCQSETSKPNQTDGVPSHSVDSQSEHSRPCREECQSDHCIYVPPSEVKVSDLSQPCLLYVLGCVEDDLATTATIHGSIQGNHGPLAYPYGEHASLSQVWRL